MIVKKPIGKLPVLIGEYDSTKTYDKKNRVTLYGSEFESLMDSNTYAPATYNSDTKAVTFDTEHWKVVSNGTGAWLAGEKLDLFSFEENPEFVSAEVDNDGKLLESTNVEGNKTIYGDLEVKGDFKNEGLSGQIKDATDDKVDKEDGKSLIDENVANSLSIEDNPEFVAINTDSNEKIIDSTDTEGIVVHNTKHIFKDGIEDSTNGIYEKSLQYSIENISDFTKAMTKEGYIGINDFSDKENVELPEPVHYAILNLIVDSLPINDSDVSKGYAQYYDFAGNYWKKDIELSLQGQSSRLFARTGGKGNYTLDIVDDSEIKFDSWVPQDSFHLKGCAKDATRGILATSYKFAKKFMDYLDAKPNRVLKNEDNITSTSATGDRFTDWVDDARCLPDGFPVEIYVNGEYHGLYSWQLKKDRKNYSMKKNDYTSFFIDADDLMPNGYNTGFWLGDIPWTRFEIKNTKNLICMDGSDYDGDNPKELIDDTSSSYDSTNKKHVGSATTKSIIKAFSTKYLEVKALVETNTEDSLAQAKTKFAEYFDVNACMLLYIFNCLMRNIDSIRKNTLWAVYKNGKIAPMLWDLDAMYGQHWIGNSADAPSAELWEGSYATSEWPLKLFWTLYKSEVKTSYANLRKDGIININTWHSIMFDEWVNRIGTEAYERDIEKWSETPSYRKNYTDTAYWKEEYYTDSVGSISAWNSETDYSKGDKVYIKLYDTVSQYMIYTAVQASTGICPVTKYYEGFPIVGGFYDSPKRMEKWMDEQINLCDKEMEYTTSN